MRHFEGRMGTYIETDGIEVHLNTMPINQEKCTIDDIKSVNIWRAENGRPGRMTILTASTRHTLEFDADKNEDFAECYRLLITKIDPYLARTYTSEQ